MTFKQVLNSKEELPEKSSGAKKLLVTVEVAAGRKDLLLRFLHFQEPQETATNPNDEEPSVWKFDTFRKDLTKLLTPEDGYGKLIGLRSM